MANTTSRLSRIYVVAGGVWLVLFSVQFTLDSRAAGLDGNIPLLAIAACIEVVLVASALAAGSVLLRRMPERGWSTWLSFACWACATALVLAALHADSAAQLADSVGANSLYVVAFSTQRVFRFLVAPLVILLLAFRSVSGTRGQSRLLSLLFVSFAVVLLTWTWLTRPQSP
jgi:hypothetical protein